MMIPCVLLEECIYLEVCDHEFKDVEELVLPNAWSGMSVLSNGKCP